MSHTIAVESVESVAKRTAKQRKIRVNIAYGAISIASPSCSIYSISNDSGYYRGTGLTYLP